jgi:uracil DNA glycosylase
MYGGIGTNQLVSCAQQRTCTSFVAVIKYLAMNNAKTSVYPPHSPECQLQTLFLFSRLKTVLKGQRFYSGEGVAAKATRVLTEVLKNRLQHCIQKLYELTN